MAQLIKIAYCDDDMSILEDIRTLLEEYRTERNNDISHIAFNSPLDLIAEIEKGARFDVLLLDVLMPGETGIDAAAEIRKIDKNVKIIFLTSSSEYAVQSYSVEAFFYQLKPVSKEAIFTLMDSVISACEKEHGNSIILRCKSGITRIDLRHIEYCEVIHRTLFIHLSGGRVLESIGSMDELSHQLEQYGCFIRPHRSYLVNLEHIQSISHNLITMSCLTEIPIPRGKYNEVKDAYLEYAFLNRTVMA